METGLEIKDTLVVEQKIAESGVSQSIREQSFGAGANVAKFNDSGFFIGATEFENAPFKVAYNGRTTIGKPTGATTTISPTDGALVLSFNGSSYGSISVDSSTNLIIATTNNIQFFDASNNQLAVLDATNGLQINGAGGPKLLGKSDELQLDKQMRFNGRIYPITNATTGLDCGDPAKKWNFIYAKNSGIGDMVIFDKFCPFCELPLEIGDNVIFHIYKAEPEIHDGLHSVPAHLECALDANKHKPQSDRKEFIEQKSVEQKAEEDIKEAEFDRKQEIKYAQEISKKSIHSN